MTFPAKSVIREAESKGITLWVENGRLQFRASEGAMTTGLHARIGEHKDAVMELLGIYGKTTDPLLYDALFAKDPDKPLDQDPRPDLVQDHAPWQDLLMMATSEGPELARILWEFRSRGMGLQHTSTGWQLVARIPCHDGYQDETSYLRDRGIWLSPWLDRITALLAKLGRSAA